MALVYPSRLKDTVAQALGKNAHDLIKISNGYRATLMALSYLDYAHPLEALQWARKASALLNDPLPRYAGYLCGLAWEKRRDSALSVLPLDRQFPVLAWPVAVFLDSCARCFRAGSDSGMLPLMITSRYFNRLTISSSEDRRTGMRTAERECALGPNSARLLWMIRAVEWEENPQRRIPVYQEACSTLLYDYELKLRLSTDLVRDRRFIEAERMLATLVADSVRYDADLYFCKGAIAESKKQPEKALAEFKRCIAMRRYRPEYFEHYGRLLADRGQQAQAEAAFEWAQRLATGETHRAGNH
jgi:tetratricopeptide (TPR) repeat protein